jgi:uncharacterized protein with von Willebrand factor type A (vWA) domain
MAGAPFNSLVQGALSVGEGVFKDKKFERFLTYFYDSKGQAEERKTLETYKSMLKSKKAGGGTNFVCVFDYILRFIKEKKKYNSKNLTVIFFTDG